MPTTPPAIPTVLHTDPSKLPVRQNFVAGAGYMLAAAFVFSLMNLLIRIGAQELHALQIVFFRNFFALLFMLPWALQLGRAAVRTARLDLHLIRVSFGFVAMVLWFNAIIAMPMAEAVALNFTFPLFVTAGAALVLGERVGVRRWAATIIGLAGALVILRPGLAVFNPVALLPLAAAVGMACSVLIVKRLSGIDPPFVIVFVMNLLLTPISLVPALFVWVWPSWSTLAIVAALGGLAALAHIFFIRSYRAADASAVMPIDYARLAFVAALAWLIYGETVDVWTWVGAGIIAGAAIYTSLREAQIERRGRSGAETTP